MAGPRIHVTPRPIEPSDPPEVVTEEWQLLTDEVSRAYGRVEDQLIYGYGILDPAVVARLGNPRRIRVTLEAVPDAG